MINQANLDILITQYFKSILGVLTTVILGIKMIVVNIIIAPMVLLWQDSVQMGYFGIKVIRFVTDGEMNNTSIYVCFGNVIITFRLI